jgi:hypothetical protein
MHLEYRSSQYVHDGLCVLKRAHILFQLKEVGLSVFFTSSNPWKSLTFNVEAILDIGSVHILLEGMLSMSGAFMLTATVENFDWEHICALYEHLFDSKLATPDFSIHIGSATLMISSEGGLVFELHHLEVGDYAGVDGRLELRSNGALLRAETSEGKLQLGEFLIEEAFVEVSFSREDGSTAPSLMVGGLFQWEGFAIRVGAHFYKVPDDDSLHYTLYGAFNDAKTGEGFQVAKYIPGLEDTFLRDIAIQGAAIIIASQDDAELGALSHLKYPIRKGANSNQF